MYRNSEYTPVAAVASAGTFAVAYPDNTTAGDYALYGHKMFARGHQAHYAQDNGQMSVSFGATEITVTYKGTTPLPANKGIALQWNTAGDKKRPLSLARPKRVVQVPMLRMDLGAPDTADTDGIIESQDLTSAGVYSVLAFNGVYGDPYGNAHAILDVPRNVVGAWTTSAVVTVTGEDEYGDVIVEKSASAATFTGKKAFKKITSFATATSITGLTLGTGDVLGLPVYIERASQIIGELKDGVAQSRESGKVYVTGLALEAAVDAGTGLNLLSPVAGTISKMTSISQGTITTGGAITLEIATVAVDGLSVVVADSAAEGDMDTDVPTAGHASTAVAVGDRLEVQFAAGFNASADLFIIIEIETTGVQQLQGTFLAGVQTTPTATTGDVRGTYDPEVATNGALQFALMAWVPDPHYLGVDNYDG